MSLRSYGNALLDSQGADWLRFCAENALRNRIASLQGEIADARHVGDRRRVAWLVPLLSNAKRWLSESRSDLSVKHGWQLDAERRAREASASSNVIEGERA